MSDIKENLRKTCVVILWVLAVLGLVLAISGGVALAKETRNQSSDSGDWAVVGSVNVALSSPEGLVRVDGLCPQADEFIVSLQERFKLRVLAVYADADQWRYFVEGLTKKEQRKIPTVAVIAVTTKMDKKSYDGAGVDKHLKRFSNLTAFAVNTRPISALLSYKANSKLEEKLGQELDFSYRTGKYAGKFDETDRSISVSVLTSLYLFGLRSDSFVTASALNVEDKFVFLAWIDPDRSDEGISLAKTKSLSWLNELRQINTNQPNTNQPKDPVEQGVPAGQQAPAEQEVLRQVPAEQEVLQEAQQKTL
ncbi:MAG: hypothetical protein LBT62_02510 [Deltaproteobacteria bacterium]|jgi:hypothetical protein|nr:hypothetical protein [Deltaproteobacteria bacterium]